MADKITLEGLAQELAALRTENEAKTQQLAQLTEELAALQENNAGLSEQLQQQTQETQAVVNANTQLKKKLEGFVQGSVAIEPKRERPKLPADPTFTAGGKKYKLLAPAANIPGIGFRKADEILMDQGLREKLVEIKSGIIKEVV